jgi:hypothetical protein
MVPETAYWQNTKQVTRFLTSLGYEQVDAIMWVRICHPLGLLTVLWNPAYLCYVTHQRHCMRRDVTTVNTAVVWKTGHRVAWCFCGTYGLKLHRRIIQYLCKYMPILHDVLLQETAVSELFCSNFKNIAHMLGWNHVFQTSDRIREDL